MSKPVAFRSDVSVDEKTGKVLAMYLQLRDGKAAETKEVFDGKAFADYDEDGNLIGVELIAPCKVEVWDKIIRKEPKPIKNFIRGAMPRDLILA